MAATASLSPLTAQRFKNYVREMENFSWEQPEQIELDLGELLPEFPHERDLIVEAIRGRVPAAIERSFAKHPEQPCTYHLKVVGTHLAKRLFIDPEEAMWVTHVIAFAMGVYPPAKPEKQEKPAAADANRSQASLLADPRANPQMQRLEMRLPEETPPASHVPQPQFPNVTYAQRPPFATPPFASPPGATWPTAPQDYWPERTMPPEVEENRWCWSGFLGGIWWMWAHGMRVGLPIWAGLFFLTTLDGLWWLRPLFYIGLNIFLGLKGNALAWQYRSFNSIEQFRSVQKAWIVFGIFWNLLQIVGFGFMFWTAYVLLSAVHGAK